jgi:hypothetical protein
LNVFHGTKYGSRSLVPPLERRPPFLPRIALKTRIRRAIEEKTLSKVRTALEKAGVEFIDENGGGPGVRLRKAKRKGK